MVSYLTFPYFLLAGLRMLVKDVVDLERMGMTSTPLQTRVLGLEKRP